jgi:hypothetical protein
MAIRIRKKKQEIEERRENILNLQSMGYSQFAIIQKLGITRMTMSRDMRAINESTKKGLFWTCQERDIVDLLLQLCPGYQ